MPRFCEQCGSSLSATARFCPNCGFALEGGEAAAGAGGGASAGTVGRSRSRLARVIPWLLPTIAVVAVLLFAVVSSRSGAPEAAGFGGGGVPMAASDISQLSPDERVDRLFNRVMAAFSAGKMDTVAFFAPMAINSFEALRPLTPHRRYDLGLVYLVSGDVALAKAESDTILAAAPKHLLGIVLGMRVAAAAGDEKTRLRFATRLRELQAAERARGLQEYVDHASDIDEALAQAAGGSKSSD